MVGAVANLAVVSHFKFQLNGLFERLEVPGASDLPGGKGLVAHQSPSTALGRTRMQKNS